MSGFIVIVEPRAEPSKTQYFGPFDDCNVASAAMVSYAVKQCGLDQDEANAEHLSMPLSDMIDTATHCLRVISTLENLLNETPNSGKKYHYYQVVEEKPEMDPGWHPNYVDRIKKKWDESIDDDGDRVLWIRAESREKARQILEQETYQYLGFRVKVEDVRFSEIDGIEHMSDDAIDFDQERLESRIPVCDECFSPDITHDAAVCFDPATRDFSEIVSIYDNSDCQRCEGECNVYWAYPEEVKHDA